MANHSRYRSTYYTSPRWLPKTAPAGVGRGEALATSNATAAAIAVAESTGAATATSLATAEGQEISEEVPAGGMIRRRRRRPKKELPVVIAAGAGQALATSLATADAVAVAHSEDDATAAGIATMVTYEALEEFALSAALVFGVDDFLPDVIHEAEHLVAAGMVPEQAAEEAALTFWALLRA